MSKVEFNNRVAIVTGAGVGLGRSHALELARRGVKVVVNDLGGSVDGTGGTNTVAESVVAEIEAAGGEAMANGANVTNEAEVEAMVSAAIDRWGHVDILVNNAGILRDKSFSKMDMGDFRTVIDVHLIGSAICSKAVWNHMKERNYGRIVMTTSASGMYGNFGQSNYGAAKAGVVGLMNVLSIEGAKNNIHVNTLAPTALTRMTEGLIPEEAARLMTVESVTPALVYLANDNAPTKMIMCAGAGGYAITEIKETQGVYLPPDQQTADAIADNIDKIMASADARDMENAGSQTMHFVGMAMQHLSTR
ncbi:MAG: SDR family NAD(P)-dependent oxidoreductase [Aquisalinus sp.]|nr:SDR family NAD(P)-dependent oxidoreductase [Aquisalinus sp.]